MKERFLWSVGLGLWLALAGTTAAQTEAPAFESVEDELSPHPELGPRWVDEISPEAREIRLKELLENSRRAMPPVPKEVKKQMYDFMAAMSPYSMREMFNFMTDKIKADEGVEFDDVIEAMEIKANAVNFKKTGHSEIWKDVGAITGQPTLRVEVLHFCDALVGRRMLDYSLEFSVFIPCRISVVEDANGDIWLMTLDWDVTWLGMAWHPDSQLSEQLKQDAIRLRDAMDQIMRAGAAGEF